jgi:hypothetical protein
MDKWDVMTESIILFTTAQAADKLGLGRRQTQRLCGKFGIGQRIGHQFLLTDDDINQLRVRPKPGWPKREKRS